jgi:hypothetical protein
MFDLLEGRHPVAHNAHMTHNEHLEEYLAICTAVFERMKREGTWPWSADSTLSGDVIDSGDNPEPV